MTQRPGASTFSSRAGARATLHAKRDRFSDRPVLARGRSGDLRIQMGINREQEPLAR
jgi:hypothetical protein